MPYQAQSHSWLLMLLISEYLCTLKLWCAYILEVKFDTNVCFTVVSCKEKTGRYRALSSSINDAEFHILLVFQMVSIQEKTYKLFGCLRFIRYPLFLRRPHLWQLNLIAGCISSKLILFLIRFWALLLSEPQIWNWIPALYIKYQSCEHRYRRLSVSIAVRLTSFLMRRTLKW